MPIRFAFLIAFVFLLLTFISCHSNEETSTIPKSWLTIYTGTLNYKDSSRQSTYDINGTATIRKVENSYAISFSNDIPDITNLIFVNIDGAYHSIDASGSIQGVILEDSNLDIGANVSGDSWGFTGTK